MGPDQAVTLGPDEVDTATASGDDQVPALYEHFQERRADAARRVVDLLVPPQRADQPAGYRRRPALAAHRPGTHHALVHECGWTEQRMADWLHATVARHLLAAS
ncbi:hypothetical protein [Pseudonocardia sp.]|uniref:hypothetical protein n=1 Tax=Pseudonocardia sp. TaxID=60912 RepID=UPI00260BE8AF|nr:hypothetical protein [Pseudonocardia sp.]